MIKRRNFARGTKTVTSLILITGLLLATDVLQAEADIETLWSGSGHANKSSGAFTHWDNEGVIPKNCAACHSSSGFADYIGDDGTSAMSVDKEHPTGTVVECSVCHNDTVKSLEKIPFPSGVEITPPAAAVATCMVCHQGRASTPTVDTKLGTTDRDTIDPELGFINIHYKAAAATLMGTDVKGGYEYQGKTYVGAFAHVPGVDTCVGCHNPHSLEVKMESCTTCHAGNSEAVNIRMSADDYDGDEDTSEGIAAEIEALQKSLGAAIFTYSDKVVESPILYSPDRYPYFFHDTNSNMVADEEEISYPNRYKQWTPRMLRAAYNYQYAAKDGGAYAHNPKYVIQLLYDSLQSLSETIDIDMSNTRRP